MGDSFPTRTYLFLDVGSAGAGAVGGGGMRLRITFLGLTKS